MTKSKQFFYQDVLPEKYWLEKAAVIKIFEYSPLGKGLKKQTSIAEKRYQKLDNVFESNKKEVVIKIKRSGKKSNLVYSKYFSFYKYHNINEFVKFSLDSKLNDLKEFKDKIELFYHDTIGIKPNNEHQKKDFKKNYV